MKKLLNTLYITEQGAYVQKERDTIVISSNGKRLGQFPTLAISNLFCFGQVAVSPFLMGSCAERGIGLSFFTERGRFLAFVNGRNNGNVCLRRTQYRWADDPVKAVAVARVIVGAKIANCRAILLRHMRNHGEQPALKAAAVRLAWSLKQARNARTVEQARGVEGDAASTYFSVFNDLLLGSGFDFGRRVRRPPTDPINSLLSFVYSLITQECASALAGIGLDPYVGFLHKDRSGRVSLGLDILEEFRASWADRFVLTLVNRRQVQQSDFEAEACGAVRLKDEGRTKLLVAYQERKRVEVRHPYLGEKVPVGLLPHCQAMLMARHLRGDVGRYPPYVSR